MDIQDAPLSAVSKDQRNSFIAVPQVVHHGRSVGSKAAIRCQCTSEDTLSVKRLEKLQDLCALLLADSRFIFRNPLAGELMVGGQGCHRSSCTCSRQTSAQLHQHGYTACIALIELLLVHGAFMSRSCFGLPVVLFELHVKKTECFLVGGWSTSGASHPKTEPARASGLRMRLRSVQSPVVRDTTDRGTIGSRSSTVEQFTHSMHMCTYRPF